ncbi:MAG: dTMP kinase [Myxococcales bacterium]|nr:dTMP kinase [Myxococcales bacterium]
MVEGHFIVLEGVDGAGTTTHTRLLAERLAARGLPVHATREPSDGPIGTLVRQVLTGRVVVPGVHGARPPSWTTMALLFAADRVDHLEAEVVPNLMDGVTVVSDRYYHSSLAYQSTSAGGLDEHIAWIREMNRHARRPDLTIILDIPPEVARRRRLERAAGRELYDDDELQEQLVGFYRRLPQMLSGERIVLVDANRAVNEVADEVERHVRRLRGEA